MASENQVAAEIVIEADGPRRRTLPRRGDAPVDVRRGRQDQPAAPLHGHGETHRGREGDTTTRRVAVPCRSWGKRIVEDPAPEAAAQLQRTTDEDGARSCTSRCGSTRAAAYRRTFIRRWRSASRCWPGGRASSAGRKWRTAGPGETVVVPAGTRHAYRNRGDEVAHVICHARPPSTLQEFLEDAAALGRAGKLTREWAPEELERAAAGGRDGACLSRHGRARSSRRCLHLRFSVS